MPSSSIQIQEAQNSTPSYRRLLLLMTLVLTALVVGGAAFQNDPLWVRVRTNLVTLPVSVLDDRGRPVEDLVREDFELFESGDQRKIDRFFAPGESALELVLLIDASGSTLPYFEWQLKAGSQFLQRFLQHGNAVTLMVIGERPEFVASRTVSAAEAMARLKDIQSSRQATAFIDSVLAAAQFLDHHSATESRRAILAISDGEDNFSLTPPEDALLALSQANCRFYSINSAGRVIHLNRVSQRGQRLMHRFATETGGVSFLVAEYDALPEIFDQILRDLEAQYLLLYYSPDDGLGPAFRSIEVQVPSRPELSIRTRSGYLSAR